MNPEAQIAALIQRVAFLEATIHRFYYADRYQFDKKVKLIDGANIELGQTTGTKIGTATTQKLSFFNATPVVQYSLAFNAPAGATYTNTEQNILNGLQNSLIYYGLIHS